MADDFFVRFGSNARVFSRDLKTDLEPADTAVSQLGTKLQALEVTAAAKSVAVKKKLVDISTEAVEVQKKLDAIGEHQGGGQQAELQAIARQAIQQVADVSSQLDGMTGKLQDFVVRIGRAGEEFQEAQKTANRAAGQRNSEANQERQRRTPEATDKRPGTFAGNTPGKGTGPAYGPAAPTPQQLAAAVKAAQSSKPAVPVETTVRIADIPKATIDEASFARVIAVGERQIEATNEVVSTLDRIAAMLNRSRALGGTGGGPPTQGPGAPVESQVEGLVRLTKEQNSELYRAFASTLKAVGNDAGPEKQQALWKQLVANQQKALAGGKSIIPEGALDEPEPTRTGQKRLDTLTTALATLGDRATVLRAEIEKLSASEAEAANGGRRAAGDAELLSRKLNELGQVEAQMSSATQAFTEQESRAEQRERQRRAAARQAAQQAGLTDTEEERSRKRAERARLELATDPERLASLAGRASEGKLDKRGLQEIAQTLTRQGYGVNLGSVRPETGLTRLTVPELIKRIGEGGAQYLASGRATAENLTARRAEATSTVSNDVQQLLASSTNLTEASNSFTQEMGRLGISAERAYQLIGASMRTGGQDPRVSSDARTISGSDPDAYRKNAKTARGRLEVGAAIGDELRDELREAGDVLDAFNRMVRNAARADVIAQVRQNPLGFNPAAIDRNIEGRGEEATDARRQVGAILRATDELDDFARDLGHLDDQVKRTERQWQAVTSQIARFEALERQPTQEETDQYSRNVPRQGKIEAQLEDLRQQLALAKSLYKDPEGGSADYLLEPGAREGLRRRDEYRVASRPDERTGKVQYQSLDSAYSEYEHRNAPEQAQNRAAMRAAVFDYFGKAKIFGTNEGNTTDYFTRALPGVRQGGSRGRERLEFVDPESKLTGDEGAKNARALRRMTAGIAGYQGNMLKLIEQMSDSEVSEEELTKTRQKMIKALERLLSGYQTAFPQNPVPDARLFLPPQLVGKDADTGLADSSDANVGRQARAAKAQAARDKIEADAAEQVAARQSPEGQEKARLDRLKQVRENIKKINGEIRDLTAEQSSLSAQQSAATRRLKTALGQKLRDEITASEAAIAEVRKLGGKATPADKERRDKAQGRIDKAYTASPEIEEAKAARDAIIATKAETAEKIKAAQAKREIGREERKQLQGRVDPSDLEAVYAEIERAGQQLARAEARLTASTDSANKAREELAARELATRERLPSEVQGQYDSTLRERDRLQGAIKRVSTGDDIRADRNLGPENAERADKAAAALSEFERRLGSVNGTLNQFERYAASLDPRLQKGDPFQDPALRPYNALSGGSVANEDIQTDGLRAALKSAEEAEARTRRSVGELNDTIKKQREQLQALIAAFRAGNDKRGDKALAEPLLPGFNTPGGGGTPPIVPPSTPAAAGDDSGRGPDILRQILAAINKVDNTLKGGLKVTGNLSATQKAADKAGQTRKPGDASRLPRSTEQGRADFEASISETMPAVGQLLAASKEVEAAATLIGAGVASETRVLDLFRDKLNQTGEEAKKFAGAVRGAVGDAQLAAAAAAAADQQQKEQGKLFQTRTGETLSIKQAKAEMRESLAVAKAKATQDAASARAEREATLAVEQHRRAMAQLTPETRHEVAELERMAEAAKKGAITQAELAAQMAKVYGLASQDLHTRATETNQTVGRIYQGAGIDTSGGEVESMRKEARGLGYQVDQSAAQGVIPGGLFGEQSAFTRAMFGNHGFWSRVMASTGTFVVRNFTAGFVFGMTAALQQVITEAIQTEATFVRVSHALEATGRSADGLRGDLQDISTDLGTNLNDVYKTAAGLTGLFKTPQEIAGATRVVSQLQLISSGALNAQEAMGALASIQGAFGEQLGSGVDGLTHVADVLTSVQNDIGTNVEVTAEGVGRMSGLAHQLGLSLEEVAVYSAQISKLTNQTGAAAGEQFSRILSVMQTGRGRTAIQEAFGTVDGKDTGIAQQLSSRDYSGVLRTMSANWDKLTDAQKQNVSVSIAGQRQAAAFAALMANGAQSINAIARAENSHGAAAERVDKIMHTLNGQIEKLGSNLQNVANNLIRSGILNFVLLFLQATNGLLGAFNSVFSTVNDFADSNPILSWLTNVGFGIVGLSLAIAVLKRSFSGLKATLREMPAAVNFKAGYQGRSVSAAAEGQAVEQTVADRIRARGRDTLGRVTPGVSPLRGSDVGSPFSRGVGRLLDRFVVPPFEAAGKGATRLADTLRTRADEIRTGSATGVAGPLNERQVAANAARARRLEYGAGGVGLLGGFASSVGAGGSAIFTGQGREYFNEVSRRRSSSQGFYESGATELRRQASRETDPAAIRQLNRQANVLGGLGRAAGAASTVTSGLSKTMGLLGKAGVGADVALGAVLLGVAAVTAAYEDNVRAGHRVETILDERAAAERARTGQDDPYAGPASQAYKEQSDALKDNNGLTTGFKYAGQTIGEAFTNPSEIFNGSLLSKSYDKMFGTNDGAISGLVDAQKALNEETKKINDYAKQGERDPGVAQINLLGLDKISFRLIDGFKTPAEGIQVAGKEAAARFAKMEQDVNNDSSLSNQQKVASLYAIEQARNEVTKMIEDRLAEAAGIGSKGLLELEQIKRIQGATSALGGLQSQPQLLQQLKGGVEGILSETGIDENNPQIQEYLNKLAKGGLSAAEVAVGQTKVIKELANQAQIKYEAALSSGDTDLIDDAREQLLGLMGQLAQAAEQNIQTFVATATSISDAAFAQGDFADGRAAIDQAIKDIESQKPAGTTRVEPGGGRTVTTYTDAELEARRAAEAQQRSLIEKRTQSVISEQNAPLQFAAAQGLGELGGARNSVTQARNTLQALRQSRQLYGPLGATVQQINDARVAVFQADAQLAQAHISHHTAALAAKAAGTWNQARQDNLAVQSAAFVLEQAIEKYGKDSIEALNAMAGLAAANKQKLQNADARAAARREAGTAAIPQGDAVAVTQSQLANANAAVAAAEKFGHNSTEYQGALAQQAQAQQAASSATAGIAVAQAQLAQAYAQARGDAVAAAHAGVAVARATLAQALQSSGGAVSAEVLGAQASLVAANEAVQQAQIAFIQSRINVTIALATAAGDTVRAAKLQIKSALAALHGTTAGTQEHNEAQAQVIAARASARDAELQDKLDTIDFNLQMGKITQSAAIQALQQILRTSDLTKQQRRQLLLQIKGMKDQLRDTQWNFGDIKLPTAYQMRRYALERQEALRNQMDAVASAAPPASNPYNAGGSRAGSTTTNTTTVTIPINGADTARVRQIIREVVGSSSGTMTRTTSARRG